MKLYYALGACSLAPHIVAKEAGLDVALAKVEFTPDGGRSAEGRDFLAINPKGAVPALELADGQVLTENAVLLQYLAAQAPDAGLEPPAAGAERWRFLELLNFVATELHKGFGPLWNPTNPAEVREGAVQALGKRFSFLERALGDKPYLFGERFSIVDAYAFTVLNWTSHHKLDLSPWPKLQAFQQRVAARPAVQQAFREEGLA